MHGKLVLWNGNSLLMKSLVIQDKNLRRSFYKAEPLRRALKFLLFNQRISIQTRWKVGLFLKILPSSENPTRANNRCVQTGRSRSTVRNFRLSRISLRNKAVFGQLLGVVKKSW